MITNRPIAPNRGHEYPAEPLTPAEVQALIGKCSSRSVSGIRNRAMLTLLYRSGLRVGELLALKPSDVDFGQHTIRLLDTKIGQAQTRGFHSSADDALMRWLDTRRELASRKGWKNGKLFCQLNGTPVSDDYVRVLLKRLAAKAGITKRVHPHGLRHTFAAELDAQGTPVTVISKLLGHRSVATTIRYIDHLTNGEAVEALQRVDLPPLKETV